MAYANVEEDLVPRFPRTLTDEEKTRATTLLEDASFWLGVWVPGLAAAIDDEQIAQAAKLLVVAMVKRALLTPITDNPGVQSITQTGGPYSQAVTFRNPEGNLYLYGTELASIQDLLQSNRAAAISLRSPGL